MLGVGNVPRIVFSTTASYLTSARPVGGCSKVTLTVLTKAKFVILTAAM
jgi:hypothetical protein